MAAFDHVERNREQILEEWVTLTRMDQRTRAECEAAGGEFTPQLFGWMVHANVFAGTDPKSIWGADHAHGHPHD